MIHTKDLRFGNKVKTRRGEVITVQQLLSHTLIYDGKMELNHEVVNVRGYQQSDYVTHLQEVVKEVDYADLEPIVLTSDVLRICGFRNYLREQWILSIGNTHLDFEFTEKGLRLRTPMPGHTSIKYLHQLQNFLYAVYMHELDVTLEFSL